MDLCSLAVAQGHSAAAEIGDIMSAIGDRIASRFRPTRYIIPAAGVNPLDAPLEEQPRKGRNWFWVIVGIMLLLSACYAVVMIVFKPNKNSSAAPPGPVATISQPANEMATFAPLMSETPLPTQTPLIHTMMAPMEVVVVTHVPYEVTQIVEVTRQVQQFVPMPVEVTRMIEVTREIVFERVITQPVYITVVVTATPTNTPTPTSTATATSEIIQPPTETQTPTATETTGQ